MEYSRSGSIRTTDRHELEFLKGQVEHYKKILREIQRIIPLDL